jgi:hypothetical protein
MGLMLLVYEPPGPGLPFLAVAAESEPSVEVLYVEAHATLAAAEIALARMAKGLEPGLHNGAV